MKKRSDKIEKFVQLAASEEQASGQQTGACRMRLEEQLQRLGELNAYRQEYASRSGKVDAVSSAHWKDYRTFLSKLDAAVLAQQQVVRDCEQNLESHRRHWMAKRQRLESLQHVLDKYRNDERLDAENREQRVLDDLPKLPEIFTKPGK